jgi:hypothetical protein
MRKIRVVRKVYRPGVFYYPHTYELAQNEDTWDCRPCDEGWHEFNGAVGEENDPTKKTFVLDNNTKQPLWIKLKDGKRLANGVAPVFLRFKLYRERDYNMLGFPADAQGA